MNQSSHKVNYRVKIRLVPPKLKYRGRSTEYGEQSTEYRGQSKEYRGQRNKLTVRMLSFTRHGILDGGCFGLTGMVTC